MQHIPRNQLYIYAETTGIDISEFKPIFTLQANIDELPSVEVATGLELYNLDIPEFATYNLKNNYYDYSQGDIQTNLYPDYTSTAVQQTLMSNPSYQIEQLLTGAYPTQKTELLIGEYLASGYMTDLGLDNYEQLIGKEVLLNINDMDYKFTISGVYSGGEALITSANNQLFKNQTVNLNPSYYRQFNSNHAKQQYLKASDLQPEQYLDSSSNPINLQLLIGLMFLGMLNLLFTTLIILTLRNDYQVIKYYKYNQAQLMIIIPMMNLLGLNLLFFGLIR